MARPSRRAGNLPAEATSFIGRRRELAELRKKLTATRLVSLVGPGGVGKSRLAIRIGSDLSRGFPNGVWLVELAEVRDPMLVSNALMGALDLRDQAAADPRALVLSYVRDKDLLLLVDNCEHLLTAAAQLVSEIIKAAPGVRVIATSREPLSIPGEQVMPVAPLELPPADGDTPIGQLRETEAIMLFTQRAAAATGSFDLTDANRAAVVALCRRLDGLPLAIELAAVRTRVLGVEQIRDRLNDRFSLLTGGGRAALPRHQTLRTTIDWSHDLLSESERVLLRRLCVFAGRFDLQDVESACVSEDVPSSKALSLLSSLVDKSLVVKADLNGLATYRLHETMREYAHIKLQEAGEERDVESRCTDYYWSRCLQAAAETRYRLPQWLRWMDLEIDNIRAVLGRCLAQKDSVRGIDLVMSVGWYWITRATTEGVRWLDAFLASGRGNPEGQFWAYFQRGFLAVLKADATAGPPVLELAVAMARQLEQPTLLAQALSMSSIASNLAGDRGSAIRSLNEAGLLSGKLDDFPARISVLQARALNGFFGGDLEEAASAASEGVRLSREVGDSYSLEMMLLNLGGTFLLRGDLGQAKAFYAEALGLARLLDDRVAQYALLDAIACHAAVSGRAGLGAKLLGAAETVRTEAGASVLPILAPMIAQAQDSAVAALGQTKFDAEVDAGRQLGRNEAIRLALGEPAPARAPSREPQEGQMGRLGKRETAVAGLVAEGLSNKQIGARLFISERTVDSHLRGILNKLGFDSRAQIAGWIASTNTRQP